MADIKNILFPTDFSENTRNALTFVLEIARACDASLHIMHSIEEPYNFAMLDEAPLTTEINKNLSQTVKKLFENLVDEIQQDSKYKELKIETSIQTGRTIYSILEETKNRNVDMIIMGAQGRTGLKKVLFGSTTSEVIQRSNVPVLVLPEEAVYDGFNQITFATDYQDGDLKALQFVVEFAKLFNSKLIVYHSILKSDLKSEIMFRGFRELVTETISYNKIVFEEDKSTHFVEAMINKVEQQNVSLLAMVHYEKSFPPLPKQQSKEMSYYSEVPLLVLPGKELASTKR